MRILSLTLALVAFGISAAVAQQPNLAPSDVKPRFDLEIGYNYIHAEALPGGCNCFNLNGGFVSGGAYFNNWLGIAGEITGQRAGGGHGLTLMTFLGGPRISYAKNRFASYAEVMFGGARASDSYFPTNSGGSTTSATNWAFSTGGGLDIDLTRRIGIRAIDMQYLRTNFPNGAGNMQGQFQIGTGIQFRFGNRTQAIEIPPPLNEISFSCSVNPSTVVAGDTVEIVGHAITRPDQIELNYSWTSSGGTIEGVGRRVTLNTAGLAPGQYEVTGRAMKVDDPSIGTSCNTAFRVIYGPPQLACVASETHVIAGEPVTISAQPGPKTAPNTTYSFGTSAGTLQANGKTAVLETTGLASGVVTVRCRATDGEGRVAEASVDVDVVAPEAKAKTVQLCSVYFKHYPKLPTRVDNEGKACLDQVALNLKHAPESHLLMVGAFSGDKENSQELARLRTRNAKSYLTSDQGINPKRIETRVSRDGVEKSVAIYLIQEGGPDHPVESAPMIGLPLPNNN